MLTSQQDASAASPVGAAVTPFSLGSVSTPAPAGQGEMPGMDMSGMDTSGSTPAPAGNGEMPGMDMPEAEHGSGDASDSGHGSGDMPGMDHADSAGASSNRPLAPVLGTFGGGSAAVLLTAGMMRRKDRAASLAKKAARAAGRAEK